ncbi:MAG: efflux RND transporter periplasmic adaptor subunit [Gammaproteobacteria bacterium]
MSRFALARITFVVVCLTMTAAQASVVSVTAAGEEPIVRVVRVSGTVTSPRAAMLSPSVGGLIQRYEVDAGDTVSEGDILVRLDEELAALSLEQARASEAEARAALEDARRRFAEAERLGPQKSIAATEIRSRQAEVTQDEAMLAAAEATARRAAAVLRRHRISAPFGGVVSRREAEVGEWVNPNDPLLELVAIDGLRFDFRAPQEIFPDITAETPVHVSLDAHPEARYTGRIQAIVPVSDPSARTFLLRVLPADPERLDFTPGMSARAALLIDTGRTGVTVPRDALIRYPDGRTTVWVIADEGDGLVVHERQVTRVVTRGNEALRDGQSVTLR